MYKAPKEESICALSRALVCGIMYIYDFEQKGHLFFKYGKCLNIHSSCAALNHLIRKIQIIVSIVLLMHPIAFICGGGGATSNFSSKFSLFAILCKVRENPLKIQRHMSGYWRALPYFGDSKLILEPPGPVTPLPLFDNVTCMGCMIRYYNFCFQENWYRESGMADKRFSPFSWPIMNDISLNCTCICNT